VLLALIIVPGVLYAAPKVIGMDHSFLVLSGSMAPALNPGDIIFDNDKPADAYQVGDVLTFRVAPGSKTLVTHRIVEVIHDDGPIRYRTKGDANRDADPFVIKQELVVSKFDFKIPYWGLGIKILRSPWGYLAFVVLPCGVVTGRELMVLYRELDARDRARKKARGASPARPRGRWRSWFVFIVASTVMAQGYTALIADPPPALGRLLPAHAAAASYAYFGSVENDNASYTAGAWASAACSPDRPAPPAITRVTADDPGFAYEDLDCDLHFTVGVDDPISTATIRSGSYSASNGCLVIPASVGDVIAPSIQFSTNDKRMLIMVNLTALSRGVELSTNGGEFDAQNVSIHARSDVSIQSAGGAVMLGNTAISSDSAQVLVRSSHGAVQMSGALVSADKDLLLQTGGGLLDARGANLSSTSTLIKVTIGQGALLADGLAAHAKTDVDIESSGSLLNASMAVLVSSDGQVRLEAPNGHLLLVGAVASAKKDVSLNALALTASTACLTSSSDNVVATLHGSANLTRTRVTAQKDVDIEANGAIDASRSVIGSERSSLTLRAGSGAVNLTGTWLSSRETLSVRAAGTMDVTSARFDAGNADITLEMATGSDTIYVDAATFSDKDDLAQVTPNTVNVVGTPLAGGIRR